MEFRPDMASVKQTEQEPKNDYQESLRQARLTIASAITDLDAILNRRKAAIEHGVMDKYLKDIAILDEALTALSDQRRLPDGLGQVMLDLSAISTEPGFKARYQDLARSISDGMFETMRRSDTEESKEAA